MAVEQAQLRREKSKVMHTLEQMRKNWVAYLFISPFYILFAVFGLFSLLFSFYVSFHRWDGLTPMRWWGVKNYIDLFRDDVFLISIKNTFILLLWDIPFKVFTPLVLATLLNSHLTKLKGFFRTGYYLPEVTSAVVVAIVFSFFFNKNTGIINYLLGKIGIAPIGWLEDRFWAKVSLVLLSAWWSQGYHMVVYLAGLQSIPEELIEAAIVDGANRFQIFTRITLPLLRPMIIFSAVIATNAGIQRFAEPYLLTGGGPGYATLTMLQYLFGKAFESFRLGYASAMGYVLFVMIFLLSLVQLKLGGGRR
ncbi:MAG: sugar ABC transporter permease [Anaerolineae bacterium]|nr:sugar ABC transporter permease [Anaerolineae bacterium]